MAVATCIVNTLDATEVAIDAKAAKEIALVNYRYPDVVPIKIVGSGISGVLYVKIVNPRFIIPGEILVDSPNSPIIYLLLDQFVTSAGAPLTSPRTCEPGPGTLILVQNDGQMSINNNTLLFPAQTTPTYGDQGWYMSGGLSRICGRMLLGTINLTVRSNAFLLSWNRTGKVNTAFADCAECAFLSGSATFGASNNGTPSLSTSLGSLINADDIYDIAIILRIGSAAVYGRARGGALYFLRGGAVGTTWTLVYVSVADITATVYPAHSNFQSAGAWSSLAVYDVVGGYANQFGPARALTQPYSGSNMDAPTADGTVEIEWIVAASEILDLSVRRTDADNRWIVRCDQAAGNIKLFEKNAGVETQRGSTGTQTWTTNSRYRIIVTLNGSTIEARVEDLSSLAGSAPLRTSYVSATFNQTATGVAVSGSNRLRDLVTWPRALSPLSSAPLYTDLAASGAVTIRSPKPYQVVQRSGASNTLPISGSHNLSGTRTIEARWSGGTWTTIATNVSAGTFSGNLTGLSAGQGTLEIRIADATSITESAASVGIGDVFVIAGQSNAQGQGTNPQAYTGTAGLFTILSIPGIYQTGADPVGATTNSSDSVLNTSGGNSLWPLLATSFVTSQGVPIMLLPAAQGGSAILSWQPGADHTDRSTLYGQMYARMAQQLNGIKAVLWWQGEADALAGQTQAYYYDKLITLATALNTDFGCKLMPCKLQNSTGINDTNENIIRAAIGQAWSDNPTTVLTGPDLSGLTTDDSYHLTSDANLASASALWWSALQTAFGW